MENWHRIPDDETAPFGKVVLKFDFPGGRYTLNVDQSDQDSVVLSYLEKIEYWHIETKWQKGDAFKLCGMAWAFPEIDLRDFYWFELYLSQHPRIVFWGDKVIFRTDLGRDRKGQIV